MYLPLPDDFHAHLRQGELMPGYVRDLVAQFGRAIIMPNTIPAMTTAKAIAEYKAQILDAAKDVRADFEPLMTFKLNPNYTEQDLKDMMAVGVVAGKYYPAGVTTNSADGISDFEAVFPVVAMMEKLGLVLCVHGEEPGEFCLDREPAFIKRVETLAEKFPKLKIVFEHLSSAKSVEAVKRLPANVAATFTVHHLMMTLDDVVGDALADQRGQPRRLGFDGDNAQSLGKGAKGKGVHPLHPPVDIRPLAQEAHRFGQLQLPESRLEHGAIGPVSHQPELRIGARSVDGGEHVQEKNLVFPLLEFSDVAQNERRLPCPAFTPDLAGDGGVEAEFVQLDGIVDDHEILLADGGGAETHANGILGAAEQRKGVFPDVGAAPSVRHIHEGRDVAAEGFRGEDQTGIVGMGNQSDARMFADHVQAGGHDGDDAGVDDDGRILVPGQNTVQFPHDAEIVR